MSGSGCVPVRTKAILPVALVAPVGRIAPAGANAPNSKAIPTAKATTKARRLSLERMPQERTPMQRYFLDAVPPIGDDQERLFVAVDWVIEGVGATVSRHRLAQSLVDAR